MERLNRSFFLRVLVFLVVFLIAIGPLFCIPSFAFTSDNGDLGSAYYLDYSFDVDIECTKLYDGETPVFRGLAFPHLVYGGTASDPVVDYGLVGSGGTKHYIAFGKFSPNPNPSRNRLDYTVMAVSQTSAPNAFVGKQDIVLRLNRPIFNPLGTQFWLKFPVATSVSVIEKGYHIELNDGTAIVQQTTFPFERTNTYTVSADQVWYYDPPSDAGDYFVYGETVLTELVVTVTVDGNSFSSFQVGSTYWTSSEGSASYRFFDALNFAVDKNVTIEEHPFPTDWLWWLYESATAVFAFELLPGVTLGKLFAGVFGVMITLFLIHLFGK